MIRHFLEKICIFIFLVAGLQMLIPLPSDVRYKLQKTDSFRQWNADVVYFGDSTIKWSSPHDASQASILELFKLLMPRCVILGVTHQSYQTDVYLHFSEYFFKIGYKPRVVIIPINMESFSPEWDRNPMWQFQDDHVLFHLKDTPFIKFYKPLSVFKFTEPNISDWDYQHSYVYKGKQKVGYVKDFMGPQYAQYTEENFRKKVILEYMYSLSKNHRKMISLLEAVKLYKKAGGVVMVYITPVDYQSGVKALGPEFLDQLRANIAVIKDALGEEGLGLLDLSTKLPTESFSWPEDNPAPLYPNAHLKLRGRFFVAKTLAENVKQYVSK